MKKPQETTGPRTTGTLRSRGDTAIKRPVLVWIMAIGLLLSLACSDWVMPNREIMTPTPGHLGQETRTSEDTETPTLHTSTRQPATPATIPTEQPTIVQTQTSNPAPREKHTLNGETQTAPTILQMPNIADTVEVARPAVVSVVAQVANNMSQSGTSPAAGTGVIISPDGLVLTNHHVVEGAQTARITLDDGTALEARLLGADDLSDLAVLKLPPGNYSFLEIREDTQVRVGEWVVAIGNALALPGGPTITVGVISALGRSRETIGETTMNDLIQTDAVMNSGNSGGPLINMRGEIVGINKAVLRSRPSQSLPIEGMGFAINMKTVTMVTGQLIDHGRMKWPYMGIGIDDLPRERTTGANLPSRKGALVSRVGVGTPAQEAGILQGDIIISVDGKPTDNVTEFMQLLRHDLVTGQRVEMEVFRNWEQGGPGDNHRREARRPGVKETAHDRPPRARKRGNPDEQIPARSHPKGLPTPLHAMGNERRVLLLGGHTST